MTPTTPSGSWKVTSSPPATGICLPDSRSGRPSRTAARRGRGRPPTRPCRSGARSWPLPARPAPRCGRPRRRRTTAARRPGRRARAAAHRFWAAFARATASSTPATSSSSTVRSTSSVAGLISCRRAHAVIPLPLLRLPDVVRPRRPRRRRRTAAGRRGAPRGATAPRRTNASPGELDGLDDAVGAVRGADDQARRRVRRWPGGGSTARRRTRRSAPPAGCRARCASTRC